MKKEKGDDMEGRKIRNDYDILWAISEVMRSSSSLQSVSKAVINTEFEIVLNFIPGLLCNPAPPHMCTDGHAHALTHPYVHKFSFLTCSDVPESGFEFYQSHQRAPLPCLSSTPHNPACCTGLYFIDIVSRSSSQQVWPAERCSVIDLSG